MKDAETKGKLVLKNSLIELSENIFGSEENEMMVCESDEDLYRAVMRGELRPEDAVMIVREMIMETI